MRQNCLENPLLSAWKRTLGQRAKAAAVLTPSGEVARTFAAVEEEARELCAQFSDLRLRSVVAVQIGNSASWPAMLIALVRGGLTPLPLGETMSADELRRVFAACRVSTWVKSEKGRLNIQRLTPDADARPGEAEPDADFLKLTSGTTGGPRAIRFRAGQLVADCEQICATMSLTDADLNYGVIPFSHSYGFSNLVTPLVCRGVSMVASDDRIPRAILDGLLRTGATVLPATPLLFRKLAEIPHAPALPALRLCISAGAPLTPADAQPFTAKFGRKIHTFYGSSECGGIAYDAEERASYEEGFVGTALRGVVIRAAAGASGAISIHSAAVGDGYFPEDDPAILGGGHFAPGDLLRETPGGLYLIGRVSEVINVGGRKLNPLEVEARLGEFPGVKQVVVFGIASAIRGEEPIACIAGEGINREALLRFCHERLSAWQVPRDVWVVAEIPVSERGKINRRQLAEQYQAVVKTELKHE